MKTGLNKWFWVVIVTASFAGVHSASALSLKDVRLNKSSFQAGERYEVFYSTTVHSDQEATFVIVATIQVGDRTEDSEVTHTFPPNSSITENSFSGNMPQPEGAHGTTKSGTITLKLYRLGDEGKRTLEDSNSVGFTVSGQ